MIQYREDDLEPRDEKAVPGTGEKWRAVDPPNGRGDCVIGRVEGGQVFFNRWGKRFVMNLAAFAKRYRKVRKVDPLKEPDPIPEPSLTEIRRTSGAKGGVARAAVLSPERRRAIARKAGLAAAKKRQLEADGLNTETQGGTKR
jgi:hypothetical protein